jgi:hypothetical protein
MKNNESKWVKTASGWQIKTAFAGDPSMTELATPSFEEREPFGLSGASGEAKIEHEDFIDSLLSELKQITDRANEITKTLEDNGLNHEDIIAFIMGKNKA